MTTPKTAGRPLNLAQLLERLGGIPPERVRVVPPPGTATEADVLAAEAGPDGRPCELVDGVLVEKPMSTPESLLAVEIAYRIRKHIEDDDLGAVFGADGMLRLEPGLIRIPDVSFVPWDRIPGAKIDMGQPIAALVPDLAVEVLSRGNTGAEIDRKLKEYFFAGTRLAWVIDPRKQTARVYTSPENFKRVSSSGTLDGAPVLPGFRLPLTELFARTRRRR
jgi:Uma2 family endonuclease